MPEPAPLVVLVVLDGWGLAPPGPGNAVELAATPVFDRLWAEYPHTTLGASGPAVGLPPGQMGNSEVGHLTLGSGRVLLQDLVRINRAVDDGSFFENSALTGAADRARERGASLHLLGLVVRAAIHDVGHAVGLAAGDRDRHRRIVLVGVEVAGRRRRREAGEEDQLGGLPAVERQLDDALVVDDLADAGGMRLDHRRVRGHRDLLADRADRERDVDLRVGADLQDDAVLHVGVEPRQRDLQLVGPDRKIGHDVGAVLGGEHRADGAGVGLGDRDVGARQRAAARVAHDAGHLRTRNRLRPGRRARDTVSRIAPRNAEQYFQRLTSWPP